MWPFGFNEEKMKKKLEELHASIEGDPRKVKWLEDLFIKYQAEIEKNLDKIKDKDSMNAQIQAVKQSIQKAKTEVSRKKRDETFQRLERKRIPSYNR